MRHVSTFLTALGGALLMLALASPALARGRDRVSFGTDVEVGPDEDIRGDVVVVGADARVLGRVRGDLVILGGTLELGPTARVDGDLAVAGGDLKRAAGARIDGSIVGVSDAGLDPDLLAGKIDGAAASLQGGSAMLELQSGHATDAPPDEPGFIGSLAPPLLLCAVLMVVGLLFMSMWPERSRNLRRTVEASPLASLMMGALVSFGLGLVSLLLLITVVGALALPVVALVVGVAWLLGITGLLEAFGDRLPLPERLRSRGWDFIAGVSLFVFLAILWAIGGGFAGIAVSILLVLGFVAVGATVLSGLGRNPYGRG
jgi:hypothetical protein